MEIAEKYMSAGATKAMKRINENGSVLGTVIVNSQGFPETTTLDSMSATSYSVHMRDIAMHSDNALKEIDVCNEVVAVRMITKTTEVMVTPDSSFHLIVVMRRGIRGGVQSGSH